MDRNGGRGVDRYFNFMIMIMTIYVVEVYL